MLQTRLPRTTIIEIALIISGLLLYTLLAPKLNFDFTDEGYVLYIAQQLLEGKRLYTDIELFTYLPGLFYLFAGLLQFAKGEISTLNLFLIFPLTLNVWLTFRIVKNHAGLVTGLLTALILLLFQGPWNRFYIPTLNLAILFCVSQFLVSGKAKWLVWLGVIAGIGLGIRIDVAVCGLTMLIVCVLIAPRWFANAHRKQLLVKASLGFLTALTVTVSFLASEGILGDYLDQVFGLGTQIIDRSTEDMKMASPTLRMLWWRDIFAWQYYLSLMAPAALVGLIILFWYRQEQECYFWLLLLIWLGLNLPQFLLERPDPTHLSHRFFALLIASMLALERFIRLSRFESAKLRILTSSYSMALVCSTSFIFVTLCQQSPYSFLIISITPQNVCLPESRCFQSSENSILKITPILTKVAKNKKPGDSLAVLPFAPGLPFVLNMPMPGKQSYFLPISLRRPNAEQLYVDDLLNSKTEFVFLDAKFKYSQNPSSGLASYAPNLYKTLRECFMVVEEKLNWQLLKRNHTDCRQTLKNPLPN